MTHALFGYDISALRHPHLAEIAESGDVHSAIPPGARGEKLSDIPSTMPAPPTPSLKVTGGTEFIPPWGNCPPSSIHFHMARSVCNVLKDEVESAMVTFSFLTFRPLYPLKVFCTAQCARCHLPRPIALREKTNTQANFYLPSVSGAFILPPDHMDWRKTACAPQ